MSDNLIDMIQNLAFFVQTLQGNTRATFTVFQFQRCSANTSSKPRIKPNFWRTGLEKKMPKGVKKYIYYWQNNYYFKRYCQAF